MEMSKSINCIYAMREGNCLYILIYIYIYTYIHFDFEIPITIVRRTDFIFLSFLKSLFNLCSEKCEA